MDCIVTDVRPLQPLNAESPIEFVFVGIIIDLIPELWNTDVPIELTLIGIVIDVNALQLWNRELLSVVIAVDCIITDERLLQPWNADVPSELIVVGIVNDVSDTF